MDSTQSSTSVPSWPRLQNIRSIASRNFCPGTSPPHSRPALPKPLNNSQLGVRLKIGGHLELRDTLRVKRGDSHAYVCSFHRGVDAQDHGLKASKLWSKPS